MKRRMEFFLRYRRTGKLETVGIDHGTDLGDEHADQALLAMAKKIVLYQDDRKLFTVEHRRGPFTVPDTADWMEP